MSLPGAGPATTARGERSRATTLLACLAVAAAYAAAGRLGLLLAIPPGYAAAIWPAAGVAGPPS